MTWRMTKDDENKAIKRLLAPFCYLFFLAPMPTGPLTAYWPMKFSDEEIRNGSDMEKDR